MKAAMDYILSYIKRTDYVLWSLCFILSGLSLVLLLGILDSGFADYLEIGKRSLITQGVAVFIGTLCAVVLSLIDYRDLARLWKLYAPFFYLLLLLTFFFGFGTPERPEDKRWIYVPGTHISIQPAELLRIAFILVYAYHIFKVREHMDHPVAVAGLLAHGAVPVVIIHFQGDDGSALIFSVIIVSMLFCAGIGWRYILGAAGAVGVSLPVLWNFVLNDFQKQRMMALYSRSADDIQGVFYQQHRAIIAFAMGGKGGKGIFNVNHMYVPEMHNDFIFSFLGESLGFVGCLFTIAAMLVMWFKILHCARISTDALGSMICVGVFAMLSFQTIINIGMNLSLFPVIGNTLPFLSYGGSSMLTSYLGIGLVLSVYMHSSKSMFK